MFYASTTPRDKDPGSTSLGSVRPICCVHPCTDRIDFEQTAPNRSSSDAMCDVRTHSQSFKPTASTPSLLYTPPIQQLLFAWEVVALRHDMAARPKRHRHTVLERCDVAQFLSTTVLSRRPEKCHVLKNGKYSVIPDRQTPVIFHAYTKIHHIFATLSVITTLHSCFFTAWRYASAVYDVVMCPSVRPSVRHKSALSKTETVQLETSNLLSWLLLRSNSTRMIDYFRRPWVQGHVTSLNFGK